MHQANCVVAGVSRPLCRCICTVYLPLKANHRPDKDTRGTQAMSTSFCHSALAGTQHLSAELQITGDIAFVVKRSVELSDKGRFISLSNDFPFLLQNHQDEAFFSSGMKINVVVVVGGLA